MPTTLEAARAAAQQGRWHAVLGLRPGASADEVRKARRRLQLSAHTDKGGSAELSQLINQASDKLLARCPEVREQQRRARECEEADERRRVEEERRRRAEESERRWLEQQRLYRDRAHEDTVRRVGRRRTRCKGAAYLGELAGRAFPVIRCRIRKLQEAGKHHRAQALAYAVEAEMGARRVGSSAFPRRRDCPSAMLTRPRAWTS